MTVASPVKQFTLEQLADKIRPHLKAMDEAERSALLHARDAGRWLKPAKVRCHTEGQPWSKWVPDNFDKSKQMADNYIRIFDNWSEIEVEQTRTGKPMTTREAIAFLARNGSQEEDEQEPVEKKKRKVKLNDQQQEALQVFLTARGVQADPTSFMSTLADFDIPLKKIIDRLDILALQLKEQKINEWLNSFQDGYPPWEDACDLYEVAPEVMAGAAAEAGEPVYGWEPGWWNDVNSRPGPEFDMLIAGIHNDWHYFVNSQSFKPDAVARKTAEWLVQGGDNHVDSSTLAALKEKLAAMPPLPSEAQPAEASVAANEHLEPPQASAGESGPADALPPSEELPPPPKKRRRR